MPVRTLLRCAVLLAGTLFLSSNTRGQGDLELATYYYNTGAFEQARLYLCLLYTSPSPRDATLSRMPSSA